MIEETDTDIEVRKYTDAKAARDLGIEPYPNLAGTSINPLPTNDIDQYFADLGAAVDGVKDTAAGVVAGVRQVAQEGIDTTVDFMGERIKDFYRINGFGKALGATDEAEEEYISGMYDSLLQELESRGINTDLPLKSLQPDTEIGIMSREMTAYLTGFLMSKPSFKKAEGLGDSVLDTIGDWGYRLLSNVRANSVGAHSLNVEEANLSQLAVELGFAQELNDYFAEGSLADQAAEATADELAMRANPDMRGRGDELTAEARLMRKVDTILEDNVAGATIAAAIMAAAKSFKVAKAFPKTTGAVVGGAAMAPDDGETSPLSAAGRAAKPAMSTADNMGGAARAVDDAADLDELGFFSQAQRAAEGLGMEKGTGQQFRSMLKKAGVKDDELTWTGLDVLLAKDRVTKQEIIDHIDANRIELQERELVPTDDDGYESGIAQFNAIGGEVIDEPADYEWRTEDWVSDMNRIDPDDPESITEEYWWEQFQAALVAESGSGPDGLENAMRILDKIKKNGYDSLAGLDRREADDALLVVARDEYMAEPYRRWVDEANGYEIVGNDSIGYIIRDPDGVVVDTGSDVPYSFNEAMVRAERDAIDTDRIGSSDGGFEEDGYAQHQEYTQPGGDNYREILLSLPRFEGDPDRATIMLSDADQQELLVLQQRKAAMDNQPPGVIDPGFMMTQKDLDRLRELEQAARTVEGKKRELLGFRGGHYSERNLVVHARVSDRTDNNGKKVLYIEELQSDWGQRGRDDGFFVPGARDQKTIVDEMNALFDPFVDELWEAITADNPGGFFQFQTLDNLSGQALTNEKIRQIKLYFRHTFDDYSIISMADVARYVPKALQPSEATQGALDTAGRVIKLADEKRAATGLAKGPFVTSTDKWVTVAMKRMLRKAIEEGYDYVAWTPGKVQADRWNNKGLITAYDTVIPKNSQKLLDRIDKGTKLETINIAFPDDGGYYVIGSTSGSGGQPTLAIPITDAMRNQAPGGLPLFSGGGAAVVGGGAAVSQGQGESAQMEMQF